jgi:OmcA/MtrC family decaheme c-type cytochrome
LKTGTVDYVSAATVDGCQKCHTVPYLKHGFIYGRVAGDPATDFYTCKGCHMDNGNGGHLIWQLLVDNPQLAAAFEASGEAADFLTPAQKTQYAYRTRLMNDVHMSHAMEFAYPQSMANCVTCHQGKLANVLTDNNFVIETCKSCHPVTGGTDLPNANGVFTVDTRTPGSATNPKQAPALVGLLPIPGSIAAHNPPFTASACNTCHRDPAAGGFAPRFSAIHTGYDKIIYGDAIGTKYSSVIAVTIDNAAFNQATKVLTWGFHATGSLGGLSSANIVPTVLVGLYGYDSKDYIFGPHETHPSGGRNLEAAAGTTHPRITITSPAAGSWNVSADLTTWAGWIDNLTVRRVEVAVMPRLGNADNVAVALNAPSRTFNLGTNAFQANYFQGTQAIARVEGGTVSGFVSGCNNCHEALGTTFHTADRGGNIVVCRLCHTTKTPSSHLELQSRSIDSYAHAIHRFQDFDIADIDFNDPVEALEYEHHVQSNFPTFGVENCRACHNAAKFNVPDQSKSLPGILSSNDVSVISNINNIPQFITGPATRACGACHRAEAIIANAGQGDPVKLASLNSHMTTFGYMVEVTSTTTAGRDAEFFAVFIKVFSILGEATVLPAP